MTLTEHRGGYRFQALGAFVRADPARAAQMIASAFAKSKGNVSRAAKELGVSRRALYRWLKQLGIATPRAERSENTSKIEPNEP